ncbi:MAG: Asr1405/Asl0597 family protein [Cyanobacteria bacterium J06597_16]
MDKSTSRTPTLGQVVSVARVDRWSINHRLQDLNIPCTCPTDGTLRVNVDHAVALLLVNSVVRRFTLPRQVSVDWLERCWETQSVPATIS